MTWGVRGRPFAGGATTMAVCILLGGFGWAAMFGFVVITMAAAWGWSE